MGCWFYLIEITIQSKQISLLIIQHQSPPSCRSSSLCFFAISSPLCFLSVPCSVLTALGCFDKCLQKILCSLSFYFLHGHFYYAPITWGIRDQGTGENNHTICSILTDKRCFKTKPLTSSEHVTLCPVKPWSPMTSRIILHQEN